MFVSWPILVILGFGFFLIGTVVGSFLNVCIYRIPWQKSVIWPGSRCPMLSGCDRRAGQYPDRELDRPARGVSRLRCSDRRALPAGRGACRLFVPGGLRRRRRRWAGRRLGAGSRVSTGGGRVSCRLLALLVAATFIDYDLMIIPDQVTVTGMVLGMGMGTLWPQVRPEPASWTGITEHLRASGSAWLGLIVGAGLTQFVRKTAGFVFRREAMGFGDVTLMGMIGAFMGWQAAVLTFFLAPFFGLGHAAGSC